MKDNIEYLGNEWKFQCEMEMYGKYKGWTGFVYYPVNQDEPLVSEDTEYINGAFNKLSKNIHIAIEDVAKNPTSTKDFNDIFIAKKNGTEWPEDLPKWE
jgi:hypothetical protein